MSSLATVEIKAFVPAKDFALTPPAEQPWGMVDFVLTDPSGVMWRIAHNLPPLGPEKP